MLNKLLPLGADELIALCALILSSFFSSYSFFVTLQAIAVIYLFICIAFRKYEAVHVKLASLKNDSSKHK